VCAFVDEAQRKASLVDVVVIALADLAKGLDANGQATSGHEGESVFEHYLEALRKFQTMASVVGNLVNRIQQLRRRQIIEAIEELVHAVTDASDITTPDDLLDL